MFEAFVQGFSAYGDLVALSALILGVVVGVFIGILPAVGGLVAMALLLPMVFGMDRVAGLSLLLGITAISTTGGSITAIVMNIPGTGPSTATLLDGFPMTQKGQAGRALGAMLGAGSLGAILGICLALLMIPVIRPLILTFGSPEMFALILMGVSFLAILGKGSAIKGMISGLTGLFIAVIGYQHSTGIDRFAFSNPFLLQGLGLVPVVLGLFAGAEILNMAVTGKPILAKELATIGKEMRRQIRGGIMDVFRHLGLFFRSCVVGYVVGAIPGIGGDTAVFVSYAQAKQTSKHPEKFGTGIVEGVIAPESANNAKEGAALLTTMALGVPGSAAMALLLGAMLMQGVTPGPEMLRTDLSLTFTLLWGLAIANIIGGILCYFIAGYLPITRIVTIDPKYLVPIILVLIFVGSFVMGEQMGQVVVAVVFAVIGLIMKRFGYNRPALLLGFILGGYFESYFWLSLQTRGALFFMRPAVLVIFAITISLYVHDLIRSFTSWRQARVS